MTTARKKELLNFWCSIGIGILVAGAALKWPNAADDLLAIGMTIIIASIVYQLFQLGYSIIIGTNRDLCLL